MSKLGETIIVAAFAATSVLLMSTCATTPTPDAPSKGYAGVVQHPAPRGYAGVTDHDVQLPMLPPPCPTEDSIDCFWDSSGQGNGLGHDIVNGDDDD